MAVVDCSLLVQQTFEVQQTVVAVRLCINQIAYTQRLASMFNLTQFCSVLVQKSVIWLDILKCPWPPGTQLWSTKALVIVGYVFL